MAGKRRGDNHNSRLNSIVAILVVVVVVFFAFLSWRDKNGDNIGLPEAGWPSFSFVDDFLNELEAYLDGEDAGSGRIAGVEDAKLEVHYLDVGQGDSILIKGPDATVLIDAGENDQADTVLRYLKNQGVHKLDYLIGTHPHSDHIGGLDVVIEELKVVRVILPVIPEEITPTTQSYTDLLMAIGTKGLKITPAKPGKSYDLGDGAELTILGPMGEYTDLNNMSVVCKLRYGKTSFVFTGDACKGSENDIIGADRGLGATVLDVGHHGSETSSGAEFLDAVSPKIAVISCGLDNSYGHPHREVMERLQERNVEIYRTDLQGSVVVFSDGEQVSVQTEK